MGFYILTAQLFWFFLWATTSCHISFILSLLISSTVPVFAWFVEWRLTFGDWRLGRAE